LILVNTGIRPGKELLSIKWNNLRIVEQGGKQSIQFSLPHTKTKKQRVVIGYEPNQKDDDEKYGCWKPLTRIKNGFDNLKDLDWEKLFLVNEYIFRYQNGELPVQEQLTKSFKQLLKWIDNNGKEYG
jgi:hypothetical protein